MRKEQKRKLNNGGFSLVELIIVVAIMAVLIGVLAPQYIRYLDKSKLSADKQLADNVRQVMTTCMMDPDVKGAPAAGTATPTYAVLGADATGDTYWATVYSTLGVANGAALNAKLKLDATAEIKYAVDVNKNVWVKIEGGAYTGDKAVEIK